MGHWESSLSLLVGNVVNRCHGAYIYDSLLPVLFFANIMVLKKANKTVCSIRWYGQILHFQCLYHFQKYQGLPEL